MTKNLLKLKLFYLNLLRSSKATRPHLDLSNATQEEIEHHYADRIPNKITQSALAEKPSMRGYKSPSEVLKTLNS